MTHETIKALSDSELEQVEIWAREETQERTIRRKQETIAKIKAMAAEVGVSVAINGTRGRPARTVTPAKPKGKR